MMRYAAILLLSVVAGCGGNSTINEHFVHDLSPNQDAPAGAACVTDDDCPAGGRVNLDGGGFTVTAWVCAYPLADGCSAKGTCMQITTPTCASFTELCGCDGQLVRGGGCFYADGYAGGPTNGASFLSCGDAGP